MRVPGLTDIEAIRRQLLQISVQGVDRQFFDLIRGHYPNIFTAAESVLPDKYKQPVGVAGAVFLAGLEDVNERVLQDISVSDAEILLLEAKLTGQIKNLPKILCFQDLFMNLVIPMGIVQDGADETDEYADVLAKSLVIFAGCILLAEGEV